MSRVYLKASNGEICATTLTAARLSETINDMLSTLGCDPKDLNENNAIPVANVDAVMLKKVIEWCEHHETDAKQEEKAAKEEKQNDEISEWDQNYFKIDAETLSQLIRAANYLNINGLIDLSCKVVANMIKGKTPEQIRQIFNITNDISPEEDQQIIAENQWWEE